MADAQLKKLETERERLQAELKTLSEAISTREACEEYVQLQFTFSVAFAAHANFSECVQSAD